MELATFGGGCFWCMEDPFRLEGVIDVLPGYMGGDTPNPSYQQVCTGTTGHVEVVQVSYTDPNLYGNLLDKFWRSIDPTDGDGQFADRGSQYVPVIFVHNEQQRELAEESKQELDRSKKFNRPIAVTIRSAKTFYKAEEYHCRYSQKNPVHYKNYRNGSGRAQFLENIWGR